MSFTYEFYHLFFKLGIKYKCDYYKCKNTHPGITEEDIERFLYTSWETGAYKIDGKLSRPLSSSFNSFFSEKNLITSIFAINFKFSCRIDRALKTFLRSFFLFKKDIFCCYPTLEYLQWISKNNNINSCIRNFIEKPQCFDIVLRIKSLYRLSLICVFIYILSSTIFIQ